MTRIGNPRGLIGRNVSSVVARWLSLLSFEWLVLDMSRQAVIPTWATLIVWRTGVSVISTRTAE